MNPAEAYPVVPQPSFVAPIPGTIPGMVIPTAVAPVGPPSPSAVPAAYTATPVPVAPVALPVALPVATAPVAYAPPVADVTAVVATPAVAVPTATAIVPAAPKKRDDFVKYDEYTNKRLASTPAEKKTVPGTGPSANPPSAEANYYNVPIMYNYGTEDNKILDDFFLEGPALTSNGGIQIKPTQKGGEEYSIMVRLDANDVAHNRFIQCVNDLHWGASHVLATMKGTVKLHNFNHSTPQMCEATGFKNPIYRARDEVTGEPIAGRSPSMFMKLFKRGKPPMEERTLFTGIDGKNIPWPLLTGVDLKFQPLLHVKRIYVGGGKASLQMEMVSAIVLGVKARNSTTRQTATIDKYAQESPEMVDALSAQVASLMSSRQDMMLGATVPTLAGAATTPAAAGTPAEATFSGITPTGTGNNVSMADLTAGAPPRIALN